MKKTTDKTMISNNNLEEKRAIKNVIKSHFKNIVFLIDSATESKPLEGKKYSAINEKYEQTDEDKQRLLKTLSNIMLQISNSKKQLYLIKKKTNKS